MDGVSVFGSFPSSCFEDNAFVFADNRAGFGGVRGAVRLRVA